MSQGRERQDTSAALPERLGRYEILLPIASGGMGIVYLARAHGAGGFEREVALKLLHRRSPAADTDAVELVEEAKLAVLIRHPNVVQVLDVDEGPLGVFMTMEYVEGGSLGGLLRAARQSGARLPPEIGLRILLDALAGLHAAHELTGEDGRALGLVHRDFSPQNILIGTDGVSKLADFGIARAASRSAHTVTGTIKGKIAYMAPEQLTGAKLDRRCDVWAAGVVAWEIMASRAMHDAHDDVVVMYRIAHVPAQRLRDLDVEIPIELDEAIARALTAAPTARCPTAAAFARTLEAAGVEVATHDEVAAHVRRLLGSELGARRARIAETVAQRRASPRGAATTAAEAITREDAPVAVAPAVTLATRALPEADAVALAGRGSPTPRGNLRVVSVAAAIATAALIAFGAGRIFGRTSPAATPAPQARDAEPVVAAPVASSTPVGLDPPRAGASIEVASAPSAVIAVTAPKPATPAPTALSSAKVSPKRGPRAVPLAASPYGKTP